MQTHQHHALPNAAIMAGMTIDALMDATLRLSDLLAEECAAIEEKRFKDLPKLQEEKLKLAQLLEAYQQRLASDPSFVKNADSATREELVLLTDDLAFNVEENFRKVAAARAVNSRVMQAIMDVMSEQHRPGTYGRDGVAGHANDMALSMNLNQQA